MNWDDLRLFLAVARSGSISGGARRLALQHSTVSRRMRKFEQELGARLLDKTRTGLRLTAAGERLLAAAERMEHEALAVDGALAGGEAALCGTLRVTAINNMASGILMPLFADFSRRHPAVELHLVVSNDDARLAQREADVAIRLTDSPPGNLVGRRLCRVASTVYAAPRYMAALRRAGGEPAWLGVECCGFHRAWTRRACGGRTRGLYLDDTLLTQAALREGMGLAILPCFLGDADPALERYCEPERAWDLGLWLLLHPDLRRSARVLAFRDHMAAGVAALAARFEGIAPNPRTAARA